MVTVTEIIAATVLPTVEDAALHDSLLELPPLQREAMILRRFDRFIRNVSIAAWSLTFVIVLIFTVIVGVHAVQLFQEAGNGAVDWNTIVANTVMPLITVLGFLSLLIATLSTVGIFFRMRTASLAEIQLRLATPEDMLVSQPDTSL